MRGCLSVLHYGHFTFSQKIRQIFMFWGGWKHASTKTFHTLLSLGNMRSPTRNSNWKFPQMCLFAESTMSSCIVCSQFLYRFSFFYLLKYWNFILSFAAIQALVHTMVFFTWSRSPYFLSLCFFFSFFFPCNILGPVVWLCWLLSGLSWGMCPSADSPAVWKWSHEQFLR